MVQDAFTDIKIPNWKSWGPGGIKFENLIIKDKIATDAQIKMINPGIRCCSKNKTLLFLSGYL